MMVRGPSYISRAVKNEVLKSLENVLCEDPVIRVDEFQGVFAIGGKSDLFKRIVAENRYEPELSKVCLSYLNPDRDAMDIGANVGFYTVLLAKTLKDRKVLSVEPAPNAVARLKKNIELNGVQNKVIYFDGVVSDHLGEAEIKVVIGREEFSSMGEMIHPSVAESKYEKIKVSATTVDELVKENNLDPGFIKIDVEGMEHKVLNGMHEVLKNKRPVVMTELTDPLLKKNGSSSKEVIRFFESYGYEVTDPLSDELHPGEREFGDILCVPI
jgi:FkbM family methyltransferase